MLKKPQAPKKNLIASIHAETKNNTTPEIINTVLGVYVAIIIKVKLTKNAIKSI